MPIAKDDHLYLDADTLASRGWTERLIRKHLGDADRWEPVNHWANFTGKRLWYLRRIEAAEASATFKDDYLASLRRRKLTSRTARRHASNRRSTVGQVEQWEASLTLSDVQTLEAIDKATAILEDARSLGFRTPHKTRRAR